MRRIKIEGSVKKKIFPALYINKNCSVEECAKELNVAKKTIMEWLRDEKVVAAIEHERTVFYFKLRRRYKIDDNYIVQRLLKGVDRIWNDKKKFDSKGYFTGLALIARIFGMDRQRVEITNNTNVNVTKIDYSKLSDEELKQYIDLSNKIIDGTEEQLSIDMEKIRQENSDKIEDAEIVKEEEELIRSIDIQVPDKITRNMVDNLDKNVTIEPLKPIKWWGSKDV